MTMQTEIKKMGNSIIEPMKRPSYRLDDLLAGINASNKHDLVQWGNPIETEAWQILEIERGIEEADRGEFATDSEVDALFAKYDS
jgi:predicted transcriptional regulator